LEWKIYKNEAYSIFFLENFWISFAFVICLSCVENVGPWTLALRNDLCAFEGVPDVRKLEWLLINAGAQYVEAAGFVKAFWGERFLRGEKVTGGLPDFFLLEDVHAGCWISLMVVPDGFDFDENDGVLIACDDVEFSATVGVVPG